MTIDVKHCSACLEDHPALEVEAATAPTYVNGEPYTHYARCPKTGRTLLVRYLDSEIKGQIVV